MGARKLPEVSGRGRPQELTSARVWLLALWTWCTLGWLATASRAEEWAFTRIADDAGAFGPFGAGTPPSIAPDGSVAFLATLDAGPTTLNLGAGGVTTELARTGGTFASLSGPPAQDALGRVFLLATPASAAAGIYRFAPPAGPTLMYGGTGLTQHTVPRVNAAGVVVFRAFNLGQKIYKGDGGALTLVELTGRNGIALLGLRPAINTAGLVALRDTLSGGVEEIRRQPDSVAASVIIASNTGDMLRFVGVPDLNDAGQVAFAADLDAGGQTIRRGDGGPLTTLVTTGPHFSALGNPAIGPDGGVVFRGVLADGSGEGLFSGPDSRHQAVIRTGDFLDGSTVVSVAFDAAGANDAGQLAFLATLADGRSGVYRAEPGGEPAETRVRRARDALAALSRVPITTHFENGLFRLFQGDVALGSGAPAALARRFVTDHRDLFGWTGPDLTLEPVQVTDLGAGGQIVSFAQAYRNLPVFGAALRVAVEAEGTSASRATLLAGALVPELPNLSVAPAFPPGPCIDAARLSLEDPTALPTIEPKLLVFDGRLFGPDPGEPPLGTHLVYRIHLLGAGGARGFLVDAHTAEVVFEYGLDPDAHPAFDLLLRDAGFITAQDTNCYATDEVAPQIGDEEGLFTDVNTSVEDYALWIYANVAWGFYMHPNLGRCSHDGACGELEVWASTDVNNAQYTPGCDVVQFRSGWASRDVMTHEVTHGVIEYTSDLVYQNQSGALNESYADSMAWCEDFQDDLLSEDRFNGLGPIRSMADPPSFGHPDTFSDYVIMRPDNGGVHTNSGITNKAHFLIGKGGRHNDFPDAAFPPIAGLGTVKTQRLLYDVLRMLPPTASLQTAANTTRLRAETFTQQGMHGFTPADACTARNAFAAVELAQGDSDCDGILDQSDDSDADGMPDVIDNCPTVWNASQANCDFAGPGDACTPDPDGDGLPTGCDNCPNHWNVYQQDTDEDGLGNACDADWDDDSVPNDVDNCPFTANSDQLDTDLEGTGDACDVDLDDDGFYAYTDNCPFDYNPDQLDSDEDGKGDACDGCPNVFDPPLAFTYNPLFPDAEPVPVEPDSDGDGTPDACDLDGQFGLASLAVGGAAYNPSLGMVPAGGGRSSVDLSAPQGSFVRVPIPVCEADPVGPIAFTPNTRLQVVALGLEPGVRAALVDADGTRRTSLTYGGPDSLGAWVVPDCGHDYLLELYTQSFNGTESFELDVSWVEATAAGNPFTQRPPQGVPGPPIPDADGDGLFDSIDKCPSASDPSNFDTGAIAGPGPDGIGDVCQCGDGDDDGDGDVRDFAVVARFLGALAPGADIAKCDVLAPVGCGPEDLAALREALAHIAPGIAQTCPAAL